MRFSICYKKMPKQMSLQNIFLKRLSDISGSYKRNRQNIHFLYFELFRLHVGLDTANVLAVDPMAFSDQPT